MVGEQKVLEGDPFLPPEERVEASEPKRDSEKIILDCIKIRGASYPAEIVADSGLSKTTVYDSLALLLAKRKIRKLNTSGYRAPPELEKRLPELWAIGLKGNAIKRLSWFTINEEDNNGSGNGE